MMTPDIFPSLAVALCLASSAAAATVIINPSDDGALYTCEGCNPVSTGQYLLVAGYIQGMVRFPTAAISGQISQAFLTINPYGLPLGDLHIDVYGVADNSALISAYDAHAGAFIGTLLLPQGLGYGQDASIDVTAFMVAADSTHVGFNLRNSVGADVFSSIEYNYGHPSQLRVVMIPEPMVGLLLVAAIGLRIGFRPARASAPNPSRSADQPRRRIAHDCKSHSRRAQAIGQ